MRKEQLEELEAYLSKPGMADANPGLTITESTTFAEIAKASPEKVSTQLISGRKPHKRDNPHERFILQIVDLAHLNGWRAVYWRPGRTLTGWATPVGGDGKDFPDLFICRKRTGKLEIGWLEVKIPPDKVRTGQQIWLDILGGIVITPADWDKLVELLK